MVAFTLNLSWSSPHIDRPSSPVLLTPGKQLPMSVADAQQAMGIFSGQITDHSRTASLIMEIASGMIVYKRLIFISFTF